MAAPGISLVSVLVLSLAATAAPHEGSFEGAGAWGGGTAFAGPLSGMQVRSKRVHGARGVVCMGQHAGFRTYLHRARMSEAMGGSGAPPSAPGLTVTFKTPSESFDETTKEPASVAAVSATNAAAKEAPRRRRGRGIGANDASIEPKPRSRPIDDQDLLALAAARKAPASGALRRAERTVPEVEPRLSLRERFLRSSEEEGVMLGKKQGRPAG